MMAQVGPRDRHWKVRMWFIIIWGNVLSQHKTGRKHMRRETSLTQLTKFNCPLGYRWWQCQPPTIKRFSLWTGNVEQLLQLPRVLQPTHGQLSMYCFGVSQILRFSQFYNILLLLGSTNMIHHNVLQGVVKNLRYDLEETCAQQKCFTQLTKFHTHLT